MAKNSGGELLHFCTTFCHSDHRYLHLIEADVDNAIQLSLKINRYKSYDESKLPQTDRVDMFWWEVSQAKKGTRPLFGKLSRVAFVVLVIPHSNASEGHLTKSWPL